MKNVKIQLNETKEESDKRIIQDFKLYNKCNIMFCHLCYYIDIRIVQDIDCSRTAYKNIMDERLNQIKKMLN